MAGGWIKQKREDMRKYEKKEVKKRHARPCKVSYLRPKEPISPTLAFPIMMLHWWKKMQREGGGSPFCAFFFPPERPECPLRVHIVELWSVFTATNSAPHLEWINDVVIMYMIMDMILV